MARQSWSASRLATAQRCLHQYYLKYVKRDYRDSGPAAKRGIAVHHAVKEQHKRQIILRAQEDNEFLKRISIIKEIKPEQLYDTAAENDPDGGAESIEEAKQLAADSFEDEWKRGVGFRSKEEKANWKTLKAEAKQAAVEMSALYAAEVAPYVSPIAVERQIEIYPKTVDIILNGKLDILEDDSDPDQGEDMLEHEVIRDTKTKEKKPWNFEEDALSDDGMVHWGRGPDADNSSQITMYNLMHLSTQKRMPKSSRLCTIVRTPKGNAQDVYIQETHRDKTDIHLLAKRIRIVTDAVEKGAFVPADPAAPGSPCSWCDYNDGTCEFYRRK